MIRQAVDARVAFGGDMGPGFGGSEIHGPARGCKKGVAEVIVVETAVHVRAEHAARFVHRAVGNEAGNSLTPDLRKRARSRFIKSFTDMDFVAFKTSFRR